MSELSELRALVARKHRAASAKVSRLRREKGVEVAGSNYDVRRDPSKIGRYNSRQLKSYLNDLNKFTNRQTKFVAGANGAPLPANLVYRYHRAERIYNDIGEQHFDAIADIFIPHAGLTIRGRDANMAKGTKRADGEVVQRPYTPIHRASWKIKDTDSLETLTADLRRRMRPGYNRGELAKSREQMANLLRTIGDSKFTEQVNKLTDAQFDAMWNYVGFAEDVVLQYEVAKARATGFKDDMHRAIDEQENLNALNKVVSWAQTLPANRGKKGKS